MNNEKMIIYQLMHDFIEVRRKLSKQYYELKLRLEQLDKNERDKSKEIGHTLTLMESEKIKQQNFSLKKNRTQHYNSFDRVSRTIVSILNQSPVSLSNKQILNQLTKQYEISITLNNLSCNILPKMNNEPSLPIQKASRRYLQYKLFVKERIMCND